MDNRSFSNNINEKFMNSWAIASHLKQHDAEYRDNEIMLMMTFHSDMKPAERVTAMTLYPWKMTIPIIEMESDLVDTVTPRYPTAD